MTLDYFNECPKYKEKKSCIKLLYQRYLRDELVYYHPTKTRLILRQIGNPGTTIIYRIVNLNK